MAKIKMVAAMLIFGTIGIFVNYIVLPSAVLACSRAIIGSIFLALVILLTKVKLNRSVIWNNKYVLLFSGAALGFNWIFLFEAYKYTTVAVATLCYYMAPVFVVVLSPIILKEKLTGFKIICTIAAVCGAVLISGVSQGMNSDIRGIAFGLLAAMLYCSVIILNKFIKGLTSMETTFSQLAISAVIMLVYICFTENLGAIVWSGQSIVLVLILGIVHTGISYLLFFSSVGELPAQTSAVFSYIDPITAIILSMLFLQQPMSIIQIIGAVLILGSTMLNELLASRFAK